LVAEISGIRAASSVSAVEKIAESWLHRCAFPLALAPAVALAKILALALLAYYLISDHQL